MASDGDASDDERVGGDVEAAQGGVGAETLGDAPPYDVAPAASAAAWHAGAYAAANEAFELLLACEAGGEHWRHAGYQDGVPVQSLPHGHPAWADRCGWVDAGYSLFRASEHFPHDAPAHIFAVLHDWPARAGAPGRPGWDASLHSLKVLQHLPGPPGMPAGRSYAVAQHLSMPAMGGLVGSREFVFVFSQRTEAVGTEQERFLSVCRSEPGSTAALAPDTAPGFTRGDLFIGAVTLRRDPAGGARLTLLTCAAPRGAIPRAAVNLGGVKAAALLADLRKRLDALRAAAKQ